MLLQVKNAFQPPGEERSMLDEDGIILYYVGDDPEPQYHPRAIGHQAGQAWRVYQETDGETARRRVINIADWFVAHAVERAGEFVVWEYAFSMPSVPAPFISAFSQTGAISVLTRAYQLTGDPVYLATAQQALGAFNHDVAAGGVRIKEKNGGWWYEHFATPQAAPSRTLNAMAWALVGLWHYYEYSQDPVAKELFDRGIIALKTHLPEYDAGVWSYYNPGGPLTTPDYHRENYASLEALYQITEEPILLEYSRRWQDNANSRLAWAWRDLWLKRPFILRRFCDVTPQEIDWLILLTTVGLICSVLELGAGCLRWVRWSRKGIK